MKSLLIVSTALLFFCSCSKSPKGDKDNPPDEGDDVEFPMQPLVLGKGVSQGSPVTASIGPSGGTLVTADGLVKINVPAGAVTSNTTFSIEPVTDVLQAGDEEEAGKINYRLLPENVTFQKPVEVSMKYSADYVSDGSEDVLMIAHQDAQGKWSELPTALDKNTKTLTAATTHFSDFTLYKKFKIIATRLGLTGGSTSLLQCGVLPSKNDTKINKDVPSGDDDLLTPLTPQPPQVHQIRVEAGNGKYVYYNHLRNVDVTQVGEWTIEKGGGELKPELSVYKKKTKARYTAKDLIFVPDDAVIRLELFGVKVNDPKAPDGVRKIEKLTLKKKLKLLPNDYMRIETDGMDTLITHDRIGQGGAVIAQVQHGVISIQGTDLGQGVQAYINITALSPEASSFPCGDVTKDRKAEVIYFTVSNSVGREWKSSYMKCPPRERTYSSGVVTIKKLGAVGELVEGTFEGPLYLTDKNDACVSQKKTVKISFSVRRSI